MEPGIRIITGSLTDVLVSDLHDPSNYDGITFWWLGQAGFAFRFNKHFVLIDPYLSDSLGKKYAGALYPHARMMHIPVFPEELKGVALVLCTHAHTDHMDPETLRPIVLNNTDCIFIIPRPEINTALEIGIPASSLLPAEAGRDLHPLQNMTVTPVASAHEELQTDSKGNHRFLGYVIDIEGSRLYHSGDCVPYDGLSDTLSSMNIDIAFLPVNGRDPERRSNRIEGNFHFHEAAELCMECGIPFLVMHHFGMFSFNTVENKQLEKQRIKYETSLQCVIPRENTRYSIQS